MFYIKKIIIFAFFAASWQLQAPSPAEWVEQNRGNGNSTVESRKAGMFFGLFIGDMLGLPHEYKRFMNRETPFGNIEFKDCNYFSDDGSMALAMANVFAQKLHAKQSPCDTTNQEIKEEFRLWLAQAKFTCPNEQQEKPILWKNNKEDRNEKGVPYRSKGSGTNTRNVLLLGKESDSVGNGCLMRNAPVIVVAQSLNEAQDLACKQTEATHSAIGAKNLSVLLTDVCWQLVHSRQITSDALKNLMIDTIIRHKPIYASIAEDATIQEYIKPMVHYLSTRYRQSNAAEIAKLAKANYVDVLNAYKTPYHQDFFNNTYQDPNPSFQTDLPSNLVYKFGTQGHEICHQISRHNCYFFIPSTGTGAGSFVAAVWAVLATENFNDALRAAVSLGFDTDTVAAITGQLAGAIYGIEGLTLTNNNGQYWYETMQLGPVVTELYQQIAWKKFPDSGLHLWQKDWTVWPGSEKNHSVCLTQCWQDVLKGQIRGLFPTKNLDTNSDSGTPAPKTEPAPNYREVIKYGGILAIFAGVGYGIYKLYYYLNSKPNKNKPAPQKKKVR